MSQYLEKNILPTDNRAVEKHLEHRAAFGCMRLRAVTEFVWIPLVHARLTNPCQRETWRLEVGLVVGGGVCKKKKRRERGDVLL